MQSLKTPRPAAARLLACAFGLLAVAAWLQSWHRPAPPPPEPVLTWERLRRAPAETWQRLPGIGDVRARRVVRWLKHHPEAALPDDLESVPGIGPKTKARLQRELARMNDRDGGEEDKRHGTR